MNVSLTVESKARIRETNPFKKEVASQENIQLIDVKITETPASGVDN